MKIQEVISNKHARSYIFLVITVIIIFAINALLPAIEGKSHYTADAISVTYAEYLEMREENIHYNLTWKSEQEVDGLKAQGVPADYEVEVYTKYFFEHIFWYITTLTRVVSAILLFYSVFNYLLTKLKDTHKRYIELEEELIALSNNSLDPSTFEPWMNDSFNKDRKIKQHVTNIKYELSLLEQKTPYKIRMLVQTDPMNVKCIKYVEKKQTLQEQLAPEYIEDIVVNKPIRNFKYIQPAFVTCGVNKIGCTTDGYSLIESDATYLSRDVVKKALMSTMLTIMFATLLTITVVTSTGKPWYWIVIDILTTIAPLLIQIPMAYDYCNSYMEDHLIINLLNRRNIALLYLAYVQKGVEHEKDTTRD